jgi:hypothetical protein
LPAINGLAGSWALTLEPGAHIIILLLEGCMQNINEKIAQACQRAKEKGRGHWLICSFILVGGMILSTWLDKAPAIANVNAKETQFFVGLSHFETTPSHVTRILLDNDFFYVINRGHSPISPILLGDLLDRLVSAGVEVIVLDLDFSNPFEGEILDKEYDSQLRQFKAAICKASEHLRIVLPLALSKGGHSVKRSLLDSLPCSGNSISAGFVNLSSDHRYVPLWADDEVKHLLVPSLPLAIARAIPGDGPKERIVEHPQLQDLIDKPPMAPFLKDSAIPSFSAAKLLSASPDEARGHLGDVAMIMGAWHERTPDSLWVVDTHQTALGPQLGGFILAVQAESIVARRIYWPLSSKWIFGAKFVWLSVLTIFLGCAASYSAKFAGVAIAVTVNLILAWLLTDYGVVVDAALPLVMLVAHPAADLILEWLEDSQHWKAYVKT